MTAEPARRRGLWYSLAAVVVVVVTLVSGGTVVTWLLEQHAQQTTGYTDRDVRAVQVFAPDAGVRIVSGPDRSASVTAKLTWVTSKPLVDVQLDAQGVLSVKVSCDSQGKFLAGFGTCSADVDIQVPPAASVDARTSSGAITVTALTGPVQARASSGAITLNNLSGDVDAQASSGAIEASGLTSTTVSATAGSGSVDLDFAHPPSKVTTSVTSGALSLALPRGSRYHVTASVGSGAGAASVDDGLASDSAPGLITATATSGAISISYR
ncbi:DUF4097 family beta strand repeat-containing protein [Streptacidiphilus rugosus]|uniref:DUF4097 family beta strand repeat-containing protein n=1 Tax=Streptacidiphilus rugosus TaxID=405783 RepID=UPI00055FF0A0|nr:DUF4097 family beta strand repeat-containing protein [Streptacidiphilus rugosus]